MRPLLVLIPSALAIAALVVAAGGLRWRARHGPGAVIELRAPAGSKPDLEAWTLFFRSLYGIVRPRWKEWLLGQPWIAFELHGEDTAVTARCWFPPELEGMLRTLLRTATPGLQITPIQDETMTREPASRARLVPWRECLYPLGQPKADALRHVINALSSAPKGVVQVALSPDTGWQRRALSRLAELAGVSRPASLPLRLLSGAVGVLFDLVWSGDAKASRQPPRTRFEPQPPPDKVARLGYRTELRLRVSAPTAGLSRRHMQTLASAFRALDGANGLRSRRVWLRRRFDRAIVQRRPPKVGAPVLSPEELAVLFHLPVWGAALAAAPVSLAPSRLPSVDGKVICLADDEWRTPAVLSPADGRHHVHVIGSTGSGKSTLLLNLALDDIRAGRAVGVIDPEGDLVRELLERIPREDWDRVRLIDPSASELPVGLNAIECADPDLRDLVADQTVTIFRKTWERWWGPRTEDVLRAAVLTLLHQRDATINEIPLLLQQPAAWRHVVSRVDDPVGLGPWWHEYLQASQAQRMQMTGPLLYKLRAVLLRRNIRNILGQPRSTIDLGAVMDHGGILLVSLAKGLLGEETSQLMGAMLFARIWQTALARADRPEAWRPDFTLYADEFWSYLHMPQNLGDVLVQARKYRLGLVLANQHLGQLGPSIRESLAANARTRVVFQVGQDDAQVLSREYEPLTAYDLRNLQARQVAVRLCVNARTEPPFTGTTRPAPPSLGRDQAEELVRTVLARDGRPRAEIEAEIAGRLRAKGLRPSDDLDVEAGG
jgi:hypothetical protein